MSALLTGGCACGAVRYEIAEAPRFAFICQCRDCQRMTGSGHAVQANFSGGALQVTGTPATWARQTAAGRTVTKAFCAACGSPLWTTATRAPDTVMVLAGSLDNPAAVTPSRIFFAGEAQPWDHPALPAGV